MSRSGRRRKRPRRMSALKFSSLTSLSTRFLLGFRAGHQNCTEIILRALRLLDGALVFGRRLIAGAQVLFKWFRSRQVASDDSVNVRQVQRVIRLDNGLGRGASFEGIKNQFQEHSTLTNAQDSSRFLAERHL